MARGSSATELLVDTEFSTAWDRLFGDCPWATVYEGSCFARIWYECYAHRYEAVLVYRWGTDGELRGLLLLALETETGVLVHVGAQQAEYQTWLARAGDSSDFVTAALAAVRSIGRGVLRFLFLAPGTPLDWTTAARRAGLRTTVVWHKCGFMAVGPESGVAAALGKKRYRSVLTKLEAIGPVRLDYLTTVAEVDAVIDTIAAYHDVRQGGAYGALAFQSDVVKRRFYLAMVAAPGLLHVTVLRAGDTLIAAHLGPQDRGMVSLGLITHAPQYAQHSPGKLMIFYLGRLLGEQGFKWLDLTPGGGSYKDRFATRYDDVAVLQVFFRRGDYARYVARRLFVAMARSVASRLRLDAKALSERALKLAFIASEGRWAERTRAAMRMFATQIRSVREFRYYRWSGTNATALVTPCRIRVNAIGDLLLYKPGGGFRKSLSDFLSSALVKLERGEVLFSAVHSGRLVHLSWLIPAARTVGSDYGHQITLINECAVLYDDYTHSGSRGQGYHQESLAARLHFVALRYPGRDSVIGVRAENGPSRHNIEKLGCADCGSAWIRIWFGNVNLSTVGLAAPLCLQVVARPPSNPVT